ncbi:hypothetical protein Tco_0020520, partial [Tanacetum coccineum]
DGLPCVTVDVLVVDLTARIEKPASFADINQDYVVRRWYMAPELCYADDGMSATHVTLYY